MEKGGNLLGLIRFGQPLRRSANSPGCVVGQGHLLLQDSLFLQVSQAVSVD